MLTFKNSKEADDYEKVGVPVGIVSIGTGMAALALSKSALAKIAGGLLVTLGTCVWTALGCIEAERHRLVEKELELKAKKVLKEMCEEATEARE